MNSSVAVLDVRFRLTETRPTNARPCWAR